MHARGGPRVTVIDDDGGVGERVHSLDMKSKRGQLAPQDRITRLTRKRRYAEIHRDLSYCE